MAANMKIRTTRWGTLSTVNLLTLGFCDVIIEADVSHATRMEFKAFAPQFDEVLPRLAYIEFWDDEGVDPAGNDYSEANPTFRGYIEEVNPTSETNMVQLVAFDPSYRAAKEITIMDAPYEEGDNAAVPNPLPPEDGSGAVPRAVYNCKIDTDDDWAYQILPDATIGTIIAHLLDYQYHPLYWVDAAPGDGTNAGNGSAYEAADLTPLVFKPQEKLVFESESIRSGVDRCQRYEPRIRFNWNSASKKWRFFDLRSSPIKTVTLNAGDADHAVLSGDLQCSFERCFTALKIYGPKMPYTNEFFWYNPEYLATTTTTSSSSTSTSSTTTPDPTPPGTLTPIGPAILLQNYVDAGGSGQAYFYQQFQITNEDERRGSRELPDWFTYWLDPFLLSATKKPVCLLTWDGGMSWFEWPFVWLDTLYGTITFIGDVPNWYIHNASGGSVVSGSNQVYFCPNGVRLIWAPFGDPISVRVPPLGDPGDPPTYEGTAFDDADLRVEKRQYDEAIVVGRDRGVAVTTQARLAQMEVYAQSILDQNKDITWAGGLVLDDIDYDYMWLNKRVQVAALDHEGEPVAGFPEIICYVTGVQYDYENRTTTLSLNSDDAELMGIDPEQLKQVLGVRALTARKRVEVGFSFRTFINWRGQKFKEIKGVKALEITEWVDEEGNLG